MKNKIKVISIDVDGCLVAYKNIGGRFQSSWYALGHAYDLEELWGGRLKQFYGKRDLENDRQWAKMDVADLIGKPVEQAKKVLYPLPYSPGVKEFAEKTKNKFIRGILSSSIDLVAEKAARDLNLDFVFCNVLHRNNGYFTGDLTYNVPIWTKHLKIPEICEMFNIAADEICHVGDNDNDVSCFEKVGLGVAFNPKMKETAEAANYIIDDFRAVENILNIENAD